ncbi:MAG: nucleotidyltransferase family protein [Deltaproteobacteria bacterium]|nr:nucleotidyltransferase family protein [Deltaproteobacteria bacterium]
MILAAGLGSRLRPLTDQTPKPLIRVGGHPLIAYSLALLRAAGITETVINLHHLGAQIRAELGDHAYGVDITYSEEEPLLDTGGALRGAERWLAGERIVLLNSDILIDLDLRRVLEFHQSHGGFATMVLRPDRETARYGALEIDAAQRVRRFLGQPPQVDVPLRALMFAGVHVLEPRVFDYLGHGVFGIVKQTYPRALAAGEAVYGYVFDGYWRVLDTHEGLAEGRHDLATRACLRPTLLP